MLRYILIIIVIGLIIPPFFFEREISAFEIRYYVAVFLTLCGMMVFGILRAYNAIVVNSRFLNKFNMEAIKLVASIKLLDRSIGNSLTDVVRKLNDTVKAFSNELDKNTRKTKSDNP